MISLEMLDTRVLVKPLPAASTSSGGIHLPETKNNPHETRIGVIVSVGPGDTNDHRGFVPQTLVVGQKIMYDKSWGDDLTIDGEAFHALDRGDIFGVVVETS